MGAPGPKIGVIGAASRSFGRGQVVDIVTDSALGEAGATLALVDTGALSLETMTAFARRVAKRTGTGVRVEGHADRGRASCGAVADVYLRHVLYFSAGVCSPAN